MRQSSYRASPQNLGLAKKCVALDDRIMLFSPANRDFSVRRPLKNLSILVNYCRRAPEFHRTLSCCPTHRATSRFVFEHI